MSHKVANIGGSNYKKMKTAAAKIRKSTGYGGMSSAPSTKADVMSTSGIKDASSVTAVLQELLTYNIDGALLMKDVVAKLRKMAATDPSFNDILSEQLQLVTHFNAKIPKAQIQTQGSASPSDIYKTRDFIPNTVMIPPNEESDIPSVSFNYKGESGTHPRQLHFINILDGTYTPTSTNTDEISVFMNSIPTIEFSRCVPFLDVIFQTGAPATDKKGSALSLSLYKSLEGASTPSSPANKALASNVPADPEGEFDSDSVNATFGMEMFTTPQTLIPNTTGIEDGARPEPVLDPFRGFMSIKSFDVALQPVAGGYYQKATGDLKITLHDRSRLHEISSLIRPDNFLSNHVQIEYGWSHPDAGTGKNDYADFLNSLRRKSKWKLFNTDIRFSDNGEVEISLSLIDLGDRNAEIETIDNNKYMQDNAKTLLKIEATVRKLANQKGAGKEISPDVVDRTALGKALSTLNPADLQVIIAKMEESSTKTPKKYGENAKALKAALVNLQAQRNTVNQTTVNIVNSIMENVIAKSDKDPFLMGALKKDNKIATAPEVKANDDGADSFAQGNNLISLGKLLGVFVGNPLIESGNYSEVQMFFYPFANRPGAAFASAGNLTTAEFLMRIDEIKVGLLHLMRSNRAGVIRIESFIKFIITNFVNFIGAPQYGIMRATDQNYQKMVNARRQTTTEVATGGKTDIKKIDAAQQKQIATMNESISNFMFPKIAVEFEAVPRIAATVGESKKSAEKQSILRVHVYDTHAGRQEPYENLINASTEGLEVLTAIKRTISGRSSDELNAPKDKKSDVRARTLKRLLQELSDSNPKGVKVIKEGNDKTIQDFIIDLPFDTIKKKIAAEYPFIEYGTEGSAVLRASVQTNQNKDFVNVVLSQAKVGNPENSASGLATSGLPTFTKPTSLSMTTMGCPLLRFRTNMFIDFKTGTSVDNLYYARRVNHSITPGSFTTSLNMSTLLADGKYRSLYRTLRNAIAYIDKQTSEDDT